MNRLIAGIHDPRGAVAAGDRETTVARALAGEAEATVTSLGALTLGWTRSRAVDPRARGSAFALLDGRLDDTESLAARLGLPAGLSAEAILGPGYERWGNAAVEQLRGNFTVVLWDARGDEGVVAVDQLGSRPLFYSNSGSYLAFASELSILLRLLQRRPPPDPSAVTLWLAVGFLRRGQTMYEGVRRLEGGQLVRLADGWDTRRFWLPRYAPPLRLPRSELVREVLSTADVAVGRRASTDGVTGVLLSGGLDSTAVAALASRDGRRGAVSAYSAVFPRYPSMDESRFIDRVVQHLDIPATRMTIRGGSLLAAALEHVGRFELPSLSPQLVFALPLERLASRDGVRVLLDGEGGDEVFGCSRYLIADRVARGRILSAFQLTQRIPRAGELPRRTQRKLFRRYGLVGAAPYGVHRLHRRVRRARAPDWLSDRSARVYDDVFDTWAWKTLPGPRWWQDLVDRVTVFRERIGAHDHLRYKALLGGVDLRHPFLHDLDLIELALRIPPEQLFDPHVDRPLLREGLKGAIPEEVRLRRDKLTLEKLWYDYLTGPDWPAVASVLGGESLELTPYVRGGLVRERFAQRPPTPNHMWAHYVWRLFGVEVWLRSQADSSFPTRMVERWSIEEPISQLVGASAS